MIKAKLSHGKVSTGYDPLGKIVAAYSRWRASHPEVGKLGEEIDALESQAIPKTPAIEPKRNRSSGHPGDGSSETALAPKTSPHFTASSLTVSGRDLFPGFNFLEPMRAVVLPYSLRLINWVLLFTIVGELVAKRVKPFPID